MLLYALVRGNRAKNVVLLIFSLIFYAWGEPVYVLILIGMTFVDWGGALLMGRAKTPAARKTTLAAVCVVNLGLIGVFKYTGFVLTNVYALFGISADVPKIALPIGISFYTFQLLSYVVDVYRGQVKPQRKFSTLLLYASLFYQCIAGPIVRYSDVEEEILNRRASADDVAAGVTRFAAGLAKKALLANACGALSDSLLISDTLLAKDRVGALAELASRSSIGLWLGVFLYMLQIYLDFSAYSDMAIGMGRMVGFHFKENFEYPYASKSVTEFWRRWHISLSSFFRDYVYIPLGGNRKGTARTYLNLFIVWLLTGLWHGASWNFVLWGLYFFVFLVIEKVGFSKLLERQPQIFSRIYLLLVVFFGWILFRFSNFACIPVVLKGMFGANGNSLIDFETKTLLLGNAVFLAVAVISVTPVVPALKRLFARFEKTSFAGRFYTVSQAVLPAVLLFLSVMSLVGDSYNPFLCFQF